MKLDQKDLKILSIIQEDSQLTHKEIADKVNLTATPVYERLKKLKAAQLFEKSVYILDRKKLGLSLMAIISISIEKHSESEILKFMEDIKSIKEIVECLHVTGAIDFQLKVYIKDMDSFQQLMLKRLSKLHNVRHIESNFVMTEVVNTTCLPL